MAAISSAVSRGLIKRGNAEIQPRAVQAKVDAMERIGRQNDPFHWSATQVGAVSAIEID
jgi:hypothetical protein